MHVYFLRHGIAFESHEWTGSEYTRPLTEQGIDRTRKIIETLSARQKLKIDVIGSSPLARARQTAEIVSKIMGIPVTIMEELASGTELTRVLRALQKRDPLPERLMLVGHEPDFGIMISELVGDLSSDYALKKAGIALLDGDFNAGKMRLIWKLEPKDVLGDKGEG